MPGLLTSSRATPGVYREEVFPPRPAELRTGVPAFLGYAALGDVEEPRRITLPQQFDQAFGGSPPGGFLAAAVRGFFENEGREAHVVRLEDAVGPDAALHQALATLAPLDDLDLVCAPDIVRSEEPERSLDHDLVARLQNLLLEHCDAQGDRFALLDSLPNADLDQVLGQQRALHGTNGALYYPWLRPAGGESFVPPCGHIAGVIARTDRATGVHKAPANEVLAGVVDLELSVTDAEQGELNPMGVNALRAFPGRGIRVWGARTLSREPAWRYINVRRLFLTAGRWIEANLADAAFEPNDLRLWARITRELTAYFNDLFQRGALKGGTPEEAFYVKCDGETNPPEAREAGRVTTEIGLAPGLPNEFVVVRIVHAAGGITLAGPAIPNP